MDFGSKFVYLGNDDEDYEEVKVSERDNVALSDSDCSDDDGETCVLDILDTAGQEEFSSVRDQYVRDGQGCLIIYSITDSQSFQEAESIYAWIKRLRDDIYAVLVANKQDLSGTAEVQVTHQEGVDVAARLGIPFLETSAMTGDGVKEAFSQLVRIIPRTSSDYKIVMLGAGAVGKSSLTTQFVTGTFLTDYDPTIEDSFRKMINVNGLTAVSKTQKKANKKAAKKKHQISRAVNHASSPRFQQMATPPMSSPRRPLSGKKSHSIFGGMLSSIRNVVSRPAQQTRSLSMDIDDVDRTISDVDTGARVRSERQRKADGNIVLIPLRNLSEDPNLVTGDPIKCKKCRAILTSTGRLETQGDTKVWTCEFCGESNGNLDIAEDEIPKGDSFDYMLSPPTKPKEEAEQAEAVMTKNTPGIIVYCMDISSSMSATCHVPESHRAWREERTRGEETIDSATRLKCIQIAIQRLAEQLKSEQPEKQVLLTVFSSSVEVKAGGREDQLPEFGSLEHESFDNLLTKGLDLANSYPLRTIEESHEAIDAAVKGLWTTGCTALGPALSIAMGYVSKVPSSEIILCTDGEPNVGIGSLRSGRENEFYEMIGNYAQSKNVTINILAMEGASTGLQYVSKAAENSGGTTTKLNPAEIIRQLRIISQNEVVATGVTVRFYLHPHFVFDEPDFPDNLSLLEKEVGSVKKETDITFKFKLKDRSQSKDIQTVPFQVQIEYTRPDGMQCLRVLSKSSDTTSSRKDMEENINVSVVGVSAMKTTAKMAQAGQANRAQHMVKNFKRMVDRGAVTSTQKEERLAFKSEVAKLDDHLTFNNARLQAGHLNDEDADVYLGAFSSNAVQQCSAAAPTKRAAMSKRKMGAKCRNVYYDYTDNM